MSACGCPLLLSSLLLSCSNVTKMSGAQETSIAQKTKEMLDNLVELIQTIPTSSYTAGLGVHIKRSQHVAA